MIRFHAWQSTEITVLINKKLILILYICLNARGYVDYWFLFVLNMNLVVEVNIQEVFDMD